MRIGVLFLAAAALFFGCDDDASDDPPRQSEPQVADEQLESPAEDDGAVGEQGPDAAMVVDDVESLIAIDTHVDTTQRMLDDGDDIAQRLEGGHLDIPRMQAGGLSGAFFSIWVNPRRFAGEPAWRRALSLIEAVKAVEERHPELATVCTTADEVRRAAAGGKVALLMGVEGAHALGTDDPATVLSRLRELHRLGVRYMTITWSTDNPLGHSSTGDAPEEGLTALGRRVVREMNRLGMIVDVSHVSDRTFEDIMEVTSLPVFASHSSARALSDHPRNMTDAMIRRVARDGGAVCVNYYSQYIDVEYRNRRRRLRARHRERFEAIAEHVDGYTERGSADLALALELDPELDPPDLETLGNHFAHIAELGGPGAACLGSDFDGIPELPVGLEDVEKLPALRQELQRRRLDVAAIFGGNVLRILEAQVGEAGESAPTD